MSEINFTEQAYCKMILHAAKYPHCSINGVLLAKSKDSKDSSKKLTYVDTIPLFHICLHVTPMIEIALTQINTYAQSKGLVIAGYYIANENCKDTSYDKPYQSRIAEKIAEYFPSTCLIVLDNTKITLNMLDNGLIIYQNSDGKWKGVNKNNIIVDEETLNTTANLIKKNISQCLVDFDNHLDRVTLDWTNDNVNKLISDESTS